MQVTTVNQNRLQSGESVENEGKPDLLLAGDKRNYNKETT
jgi:hypothetical protein